MSPAAHSAEPLPVHRRDLDFARGVPLGELAQGVTTGHVGDQPVLLYRQGDACSLVAARCSHYGAPLETGLLRGDEVMCPWHHACFSLRDGSVRKAPGLAPLATYSVREQDGRLFAGPKQAPLSRPASGPHPAAITVLGGGAAATSAVAELQSRGYAGSIAIYSADDRPPYDRVKLSKACLAGQAKVADLPLDLAFLPRPELVRVVCGHRATALDVKAKRLTWQDGTQTPYERLLLATGAAPKRLRVPGSDLPHVHVLRTARDGERLLTALEGARRICIVGASFIGLEAAAALRARGLEVDVISPHALPFAKVLGPELAQVLRHEHKKQGVRLHGGAEVTAITPTAVELKGGRRLPAEVVLLAVGVAPETEFLARAGLAVGDGVLVDAQLKTSVPHVYAAGDVAALPSGGQAHRIEHWAVAEQMGRIAARNLLGEQVAYAAVPFFWTEHYKYKIRYVGHARTIDHCEVFGDLEANHAVVAVYQQNAIKAVITLGRDDVSVACEAALARGDARALARAIRS